MGVHVIVIAAGFFAPYDFGEQNRMLTFAPPTRIHFLDAEVRFHLRPFVSAFSERPGAYGVYKEAPRKMYPIQLFPPGPKYLRAGFIPATRHLFGVEAPGKVFLL